MTQLTLISDYDGGGSPTLVATVRYARNSAGGTTIASYALTYDGAAWQQQQLHLRRRHPADAGGEDARNTADLDGVQVMIAA